MRGLGQTPNFANATDLLSYCAANPTLQAGYAPAGQSNAQVLGCEEWPSVLPPTQVTVFTSPATPTTCFQLFGSTEPCIGPIGQYTAFVLIAVGIGIWFMVRRG